MRTLICAAVVSVMCLSQGCSIKQHVTPVANHQITEIAIVQNPKVRESYLVALEQAVKSRGIETTIAPASASEKDYPYAITYTARWGWDIALYMINTRITVYENGNPVGNAAYDSSTGSFSTRKFVNAEEKINELVGQLFPKKPD